MELRLLGRTDLHVSPLALGTARFGWRTDSHESATMLTLFCAHGGNLVVPRERLHLLRQPWMPENRPSAPLASTAPG